MDAKELLERVDAAIVTLSIMGALPTMCETLQACRDYIVDHQRVFVGWNDGDTVCAECGAGDTDCREWECVFEDDLDKVSERVCMDCKRDLRELVKHGFHRPADAFFEFARTR